MLWWDLSKAAMAIIQDLLTFRADRDRSDALATRLCTPDQMLHAQSHPNISFCTQHQNQFTRIGHLASLALSCQCFGTNVDKPSADSYSHAV
eukprot:5983941-Amphidinium_carterae.1